VRAGIRRAMGKRDIYLNLLHKFKRRFADFSSVLQGCFVAGDMEAAMIQVHSLKGIAASLGAISLHSGAKELEQQLRRGEPPVVLPRVEQLLDELLQQLNELDFSALEVNTHSACSEENDTPKNMPPWGRSLKELQSHLRKLQVNKVKAQLEQLRQRNWTEPQQEQLQHLEQMVQGYKYKQAAEYIDRLL
jgi:HPt (histidine-containing phosphotransfer) domain-containing protein